jgi:pimeloyl-ACP methyl ester carboxylesterase
MVARWLSAALSDDETPTCLGPNSASRHIVYLHGLHGLDGATPSWQELANRRALAAIPDAAIAMPRAPACESGRCWSDADDGTPQTISAIRNAARTCFDERASYGVVGFSRGGYALARLATCEVAGARWAIVASAFGYTEDLRLRDCPVAIVVGRDDSDQCDGAVGYAQRRRAAGLPTELVEFDGGHRLDAEALTSAIEALEQHAGAQ